MSKRKTVGLGNLQFQKIDPYGRRAGEGAAPTLYALQEVYPDPNQPRRLLPADLHQRFFQGEAEPGAILAELLRRARATDAAPALATAVTGLRQLAQSIEQQGLINPITIRPRDDALVPASVKYLIVTGERRWWAHVLLALEERRVRQGKEPVPPTRIPASLVADDTVIRAHQLVENIMREDINVLERAQGLVALRDELSHLVAREAPAGQGGRPVSWTRVEQMVGLSRPYRVRTLKVLQLCPEAQRLVAENSLSERAIRPVTEKLADQPEMQVEALETLIRWQREEARGLGPGRRLLVSFPAYVDQLLARQEQPERPEAGRVRPAPIQQLRAKIRGALRFVSRLDRADAQVMARVIHQDPAYADLVADLRALRQRIDELLAEKTGE